ncbi:MAG: class I SAM-dependent methyltransferase [Crocinitomicaceae bacterium]|nr:class I SAM-dependent methyltransferase [Crocinitomicaceae bacterium]
MKLLLEYIKYRWKAKLRHGIHSPFVYDLSDNCLSISISKEDQQSLNAFFSKLSSDNRTIDIQDFGAGSKRLSSHRKVSKILSNSSSKGKYGKLLYQISKHYRPERTLELGTSLGVGTHYLHLGFPEGKITTIEACPNTRSIALENLPTGINSIQSTFSNYLPQIAKSFDLVFIDGHHDGDALLKYLEESDQFTHDDTIFILDDIRWSASMKAAWNKIIDNPKYNVTLDFFRVGIIVKRPTQEKEHFSLRM